MEDPAIQIPADIHAIFFDAGHTIIRSEPDVAGIYSAASAHFDVTLSQEHVNEILRVLVATYDATTASVMKTAVTDEADRLMWRTITRPVYDALPELASVDFDAWFERIHDMFIDPATWQPYDDTFDVFETLKARGLRLAVVSNWSTHLPEILDAKGLTPFFDAIVVSCIEGYRKPDPGLFRVALERTGADAARTIHVGDTYVDDVLGAREVGIHPVLISRKPQPRNDSLVIESLSELLTLIRPE